MNIREAKEIISFCQKTGFDFFHHKYSEVDFNLARGMIAGWNLRGAKDAEASDRILHDYGAQMKDSGNGVAIGGIEAAETIRNLILSAQIDEKECNGPRA